MMSTEDIKDWRLKPTKPGQCPSHPGRPAVGCVGCLVDARVEGDRDAVAAWYAELAGVEADARFPNEFTDARLGDVRDVQSWFGRYSTDPRSAPWLLLNGPTGAGKTHQGYAALREAVSVPIGGDLPSWEAGTAEEFLAGSRPGPGAEDHMRRWCRAGIALLDDFGTSALNAWAEQQYGRLIDTRYKERRPTIITTNVPASKFSEVFGDRIASRLAQRCRGGVVVVDGPDRRRKNPTPDTKE